MTMPSFNAAAQQERMMAEQLRAKYLAARPQRTDLCVKAQAVSVKEKVVAPTEKVMFVERNTNKELGFVPRQEAEWRVMCMSQSKVFIYSPKKKAFLVRLRSSTSDMWPSYWDLATGGVVTEDDMSVEVNARRQVEKQLGINMHSDLAIMIEQEKELTFEQKLSIPPMRFIDAVKYEDYEEKPRRPLGRTYNLATTRYFCNIYVYKMNFHGDEDMLKLNPDQTQLVEWWDQDQIDRVLEMSEKGENWLFVTPDTLKCLKPLRDFYSKDS